MVSVDKTMDKSIHTVLVIGAAGFLGRYATQHFYERGCKVIGVDLVPAENAPLTYLAEYFQITLPSPSFVSILNDTKPSVCLYCGGCPSVGLSLNDPAGDFHSGPVLLFEILDDLRIYAPECKLIFLSSAAVYGNPHILPIDESQPLAPLSPYGFHKWQAELLCQEFSSIYHVPTASLRIFSAYGSGLRRQVVWDISRKALTGDKLNLQGTGNESRDFIHAMDIARAMDVVAASAPMCGEVYNLATGREVTVTELANLILDILGIETRPLFDGVVPPGTPLHWRADISRIIDLGFRPEISLESGIKMFVEWCQVEMRAT